MNQIYFSIVIPTYNGSKIIEETLSALCNQKGTDHIYEIIPVDNNSTDNTRDIIKNFSQQTTIPINYTFEERPGSANARNTGFKAARGEIIGLIDDDIIVNDNWVREILKPYSDPEVGAVGGKILLKWINGTPPNWFKPYEGWLGKLDFGIDTLELISGQHINAGNYSIRRDTLFKVGGYPPCDAPGDKLVGDGECGLNQKVYSIGQKIIWTPDAVGLHVNDASTITLSYMLHRAKQHGKGNAYTFYRNHSKNLLQIAKYLFIKSIAITKNVIQIIRYYNSRNRKYYDSLFDYKNKLWSIFYLLTILIDSKLRKLVQNNNWLN